jgi:hypothetical protein
MCNMDNRCTKEGDSMQELNDYSGEFNPAIKYKDFSKEALLKALNAYASYIRRLDGIWYLTVKEQVNDDMAFVCDRLVWDKMEVHDADMIRKLLRIEANDVAAMFKTLQMSPWTWNLRHHFELRTPHHGIWTVNRCPTLLALENEGEGREQRICCQIETELFQIRAHYINPQMKVRPLKLPPRKGRDEVACRWEFKIEE